MPDPNITEPVIFTGTDGSTVRLYADYGRLVVDGRAELEWETGADFACWAFAILVEARKREAARLAYEDETAPAGEENQ
jgi:hypothetical protein